MYILQISEIPTENTLIKNAKNILKWPKIAKNDDFCVPNGQNDPRNTNRKYTNQEWLQITTKIQKNGPK